MKSILSTSSVPIHPLHHRLRSSFPHPSAKATDLVDQKPRTDYFSFLTILCGYWLQQSLLLQVRIPFSPTKAIIAGITNLLAICAFH
jgi:hypothetical protein